MKIQYNREDKVLTVKMTEEIDHHFAEKIRNNVDFEIQRYLPKEVTLDFEEVKFMDSAGIGLIIGRYKTASMYGCKINMINVEHNVKKVLDMAGISKLLPINEKIGGEKFERCI